MYRRCTKHVQKMYNIYRILFILIEVLDYSSRFCCFFQKLKRKLSPPGGKKYLGTTKACTRMILVHVQKMYNMFRILIGVPDYRSSFFVFVFLNEEEAIPPPPQAELQTRKLGHKQNVICRNTNTTGKKIK